VEITVEADNTKLAVVSDGGAALMAARAERLARPA